MFVGSFKSYADMEAKKKAQLDLLKIMAENEEEKERRVRDYKNPFIPAPVPPPFKTAGQRRGEVVEQEKTAYTNLSTIGDLSVSEILFVINAIRKSDESEGIVKFNAFFPQIKNRLLRSVSPSLITANYLANWVVDYIRRSDTMNPLAFYTTGELLQSSFADTISVYPNFDIVAEFNDVVGEFYSFLQQVGISDTLVDSVDESREKLADLLRVMPNQKDLNEVQQKASSAELETFSKFLQTYYIDIGALDNRVINSLTKDIKEKMSRGITAPLESVAKLLIRRVRGIKPEEFLDTQHERYLEEVGRLTSENSEREAIIRDYNEVYGVGGGDAGEGGVPTQQIGASQDLGAEETKGGDDDDDDETALSIEESVEEDIEFVNAKDYADEIFAEIQQLDLVEQIKQVRSITLIIYNAYSKSSSKLGGIPKSQITPHSQGKFSISKVIYRDMDENEMEMLRKLNIPLYELAQQVSQNEEVLEGAFEALIAPVVDLGYFEELKEFVKRQLVAYITAKQKVGNYNPASKVANKDTLGAEFTQSGRKYGYNLKRGFGGKPTFRVVKGANTSYHNPLNAKQRKELLKAEQVATMGLSKGLRPSNPRVGKPYGRTLKIGRGINVEVPEETYKTFGKHILHYPQLRDTNTLNIKFPSGTKNYVKKQVVSNNYKDLIMDILERGKVSDLLYDKLEEGEMEHFNKIVKGAGLMEQLKVKPPKDSNMKVLAERFKILRGQFIAGNNAPTLIEELKKIIVVFMSKDILSKEEGKELLKELSGVPP